MTKGTNCYKVPLVGINGKLNETIEVSAIWSSAGLFRFCMVLHYSGIPLGLLNVALCRYTTIWYGDVDHFIEEKKHGLNVPST